MTTIRAYESANYASRSRSNLAVSQTIDVYHFGNPTVGEDSFIIPRQHSWDGRVLTANFLAELRKSREGVIITPYLMGKEYGAGESMVVHTYSSNTPSLRTQHGQWSNLKAVSQSLPISEEPDTIGEGVGSDHSVVQEFALGVEDVQPDANVVDMAERIVRAAQASVRNPDIVLDDDGEISLHLRLPDGRLLMAELAVDGTIWAGVYDDRNDGGREVELMMPATETELISLFGQS